MFEPTGSVFSNVKYFHQHINCSFVDIFGGAGTKVWDRARIKLVIPGSVVRLASVARHFTDCGAYW